MAKRTSLTKEEHEIKRFALEKMQEWNLDGWTFAFNRRNSFGTCDVVRKRIELSSYLLPSLSIAEREDTVLHEIAHALDHIEEDQEFFRRYGYALRAGEPCPPGWRQRRGHGPDWERWCRTVGAKPERYCTTYDASKVKAKVKPPPKWTLRCPNGHEFHQRRLVRRDDSSCSLCAPGRFVERYKLTVIQNH